MKKPKIDHDVQTMWDEGISDFTFQHFRYYVKPLACREKLRPKHWQRLYQDFAMECDSARIPEDRGLIERVITNMMNESRSWCNPEVFDDAGLRAALRKAFDQILAAQDSNGFDGPSEDSGQLSQPVDMEDVQARRARRARRAHTEALLRECSL